MNITIVFSNDGRSSAVDLKFGHVRYVCQTCPYIYNIDRKVRPYSPQQDKSSWYPDCTVGRSNDAYSKSKNARYLSRLEDCAYACRSQQQQF